MIHCMVQKKGKIICAIGDLFSSKEKKSKIGKCSSQEEKVTRLPKDGWFRTTPHWMLYMLGHVPKPHWRNLKRNAGSLNTRFDGSSWMQDMWSMQCWMKMTTKKKQPYSLRFSVHGSGWINGSNHEKVLTNRLCLGIGRKSQEEPTLTVWLQC